MQATTDTYTKLSRPPQTRQTRCASAGLFTSAAAGQAAEEAREWPGMLVHICVVRLVIYTTQNLPTVANQGDLAGSTYQNRQRIAVSMSRADTRVYMYSLLFKTLCFALLPPPLLCSSSLLVTPGLGLSGSRVHECIPAYIHDGSSSLVSTNQIGDDAGRRCKSHASASKYLHIGRYKEANTNTRPYMVGLLAPQASP
jgi:hypothetical protein